MNAIAILALVAFQNTSPPVNPNAAATAADHQRLLVALKIESLRRGANGSNMQAPNAANYNEAYANPYPRLPDPLQLKNGRRVKDEAGWWKQRRPEIVEDFEREIYGRVPKQTPPVRWEVLSTVEEIKGEHAVRTRKLKGVVDNSSYPEISVALEMTVSTPAKAGGKVPLILEFGFPGGFRGAFPGRVGAPAPPPSPPPPPPPPVGSTWQEQVLARGWGYAVLLPSSIQADNGAGLTQGIIGLLNKGQARQPEQWGALRAWAWGASRALDFFESDPSVDAKRVGIEGHSRYGKAAAVAMAFDQRFAIAFLSSSGEGGVKLHRRNYGELVENVAAPSEYHWMAGNFVKYAGPLTWDDLPVDAHELIALCAPRPVFISAGDKGDSWVDPKGMFLAGVGAGPVYRLLGKRDLGSAEFPLLETGLMDGEIAFRQHAGGHTPGPNWPTFLNFASRYFQAR